MLQTSPPTVLIIAGLDPSGGAGLCADIQATTACRVHPMPVATVITAQSLRRVARVDALEPALISEQIAVALEDIQPSAVKIGALGTGPVAEAVGQALDTMVGPDTPVVLDPVLVATSGDALGDASLPAVMRSALIPRATLITPNADELHALSTADSDDARARSLVTSHEQYVLATGLVRAGERAPGSDDATVEDRLIGRDGVVATHRSPRLPGEFHGSGCSLAAYCAAHLALGKSMHVAVADAHRDAGRALARALDFGFDVRVPARHA